MTPTRQQAAPVTQIGNGNARHRVTLPDGTEVTIAWAAMKAKMHAGTMEKCAV